MFNGQIPEKNIVIERFCFAESAISESKCSSTNFPWSQILILPEGLWEFWLIVLSSEFKAVTKKGVEGVESSQQELTQPVSSDPNPWQRLLAQEVSVQAPELQSDPCPVPTFWPESAR